MLTRRQHEVLSLFCSGLTYKQVADTLGISPETVNPSLKQSARRLGASGIGRQVLKQAATARGVSLDPGDQAG